MSRTITRTKARRVIRRVKTPEKTVEPGRLILLFTYDPSGLICETVTHNPSDIEDCMKQKSLYGGGVLTVALFYPADGGMVVLKDDSAGHELATLWMRSRLRTTNKPKRAIVRKPRKIIRR